MRNIRESGSSSHPSMHSEFLLKASFLVLAVYVCAILSSVFHLADGWEVSIAETFLPLVEKAPTRSVPDPDYGIRAVMFNAGEPNDHVTVMRNIIAAAKEFKSRGVKAIFVSIPSMLFTDRNAALVRELSRIEGSVIWEWIPTAMPVRNPIWLNPPLRQAGIRWGVATAMIEHRMVPFAHSFPTHLTVRLYPNAVRNPISRKTVEDISLLCVRLIKGYSDSVEVGNDGVNLFLGDVSLPTARNGMTLLRMRHPAFRRDPTPISVSYGLDATKGLHFDGLSRDRRDYVSSRDLSSYGDDLRGKIIFLEARNFGGSMQNEQYPGFHAAVVEAILAGGSLTILNEWTTAITLLIVLASAALCLFLRPLPAILLNAVLAAGVIALHLYCYAMGHLVFQIQYGLMAIALSILFLPLFRISWEMRMLKARLAEHNL